MEIPFEIEEFTDEIEYASKEELYFSWWLDELVREQYIESYEYEIITFNLSSEVCYNWKKIIKLKTKIKVEEKKQTLLKGHVYTPDFAVHWTQKAIGVFCNTMDQLGDPKANSFFLCDEDLHSIIEIKPIFDMNNMTRLAKINIKLVYEMFTKYVQLVYVYPRVRPNGSITPKGTLFSNTFVPEKYLTTDKSGKPRKITFEHLTIHQFLRNE